MIVHWLVLAAAICTSMTGQAGSARGPSNAKAPGRMPRITRRRASRSGESGASAIACPAKRASPSSKTPSM